MSTKKEIRKSIIEKRDKLSVIEKNSYDDKIFTKVKNLKAYKEATVIFTFISFGSEVDTLRLIDNALREGKAVAVPWINKEKKLMEAKVIRNLEDMHPGHYGILEPSPDAETLKPQEIDLIITPGVAFDSLGGRIGYGGGYYDKFLAEVKNNVPKVALSYELQKVEKLPLEPFDMKVTALITEENELWF
ncbi:5-formyltetrahydrofolate cyclo-ligase [Alloiococcus sp. CFN-8]|uniref:5-formyltetrahydrofolate cyclo-ligase n=1 Tax=Alloiococcus sp. CFN-8 TaxID=3416081 RepID=UPI003CF56973